MTSRRDAIAAAFRTWGYDTATTDDIEAAVAEWEREPSDAEIDAAQVAYSGRTLSESATPPAWREKMAAALRAAAAVRRGEAP